MNPTDPEFPLDDNIVHLNHAGVAPWPKRTAQAIQQFAVENTHMGSRRYVQWLQTEDALREQLRWLINARSRKDIALLKNTSEALSVVAFGIPWEKGDNVVTSLQEFPSNRIVWQALKQRYGIDVRLADLDNTPNPEDAIEQKIDDQTRLVAVSSVQYGNGLRMDLRRIGTHCHSRDVLFCVDAIQSLGSVPFDSQDIHADFVVADGHKWMLGPEGVALFYCSPGSLEQLQLNQYGWHMVENHDDFEQLDWLPAKDSRRFECGSPNNLGIHALHASLSLLQEHGIETIHQKICDNVQYIHERISELELECLTPMPQKRRAGILTFRHPQIDNILIYRQLQQRGVLCAFRSGGIRFSPHFYTPHKAIDRALDTLKDILASQ
jgi:selenocysteine lyase/cysteine desulfurase